MFKLRKGVPKDVFDIQRVYQLAEESLNDESFFFDFKRVKKNLCKTNNLWLVLEVGGKVEGYVRILIEPEQRLARVSRLLVTFSSHIEKQERTEYLLQGVLDYFKNEKTIDVIYCTARPIDRFQMIPVNLGFKVLGIFPNGQEDSYKIVNSLCAYFFDGFFEKRSKNLRLHSELKKLYSIVQRQCEIPDLEFISDIELPEPEGKMPKLELISAPAFVAHRYSLLKEKRLFPTLFYPFQEPNALITDPNQEMEFFIRISKDENTALIVAEKVIFDGLPISLYKNICKTLKEEKGLTYIEAINDAGDPIGTELLIRSGFLPCGYFPGLKKQGSHRRDYVVFGRSYENFHFPENLNIETIFGDYLSQYFEQVQKHYQHPITDLI